MSLTLLYETEDRPLIEMIKDTLADKGIESVLFDEHTSQLWPSTFTVRLMVLEEDLEAAKAIVDDIVNG